MPSSAVLVSGTIEQDIPSTVPSDGLYHFTFDMALSPDLDIKTGDVIQTIVAVGIYRTDLSDFTPQKRANLGEFKPTTVSPTYATGQVTNSVNLKSGVNYTLVFFSGGWRSLEGIPALIQNISAPIAG